MSCLPGSTISFLAFFKSQLPTQKAEMRKRTTRVKKEHHESFTTTYPITPHPPCLGGCIICAISTTIRDGRALKRVAVSLRLCLHRIRPAVVVPMLQLLAAPLCTKGEKVALNILDSKKTFNNYQGPIATN